MRGFSTVPSMTPIATLPSQSGCALGHNVTVSLEGVLGVTMLTAQLCHPHQDEGGVAEDSEPLLPSVHRSG